MVWHVVLFLKAMPTRLTYYADGFRIARVSSSCFGASAGQLNQTSPDFPTFIEHDVLTVAAVRVTTDGGDDDKRAAWKARSLLGHFVDAVAIAFGQVPRVADLLLLRKAGEDCAEVVVYRDQLWATMARKGSEDEKDRLARRSEELLVSLGPLLDSAFAAPGWGAMTELQKQLLYSARLYRKGCEGRSFGLEFLCKFAAVEGLTVATVRSSKYAVMRDRLVELMRPNDAAVEERIRKLDEKRHLIAHEAMEEQFPDAPDPVPYAIDTLLLDEVAAAVFSFASANLGVCRTVKDLWERGKRPEQGSALTERRSSTVVKVAVRNMLSKRKQYLRGLGSWLDELFLTEPAPSDGPPTGAP